MDNLDLDQIDAAISDSVEPVTTPEVSTPSVAPKISVPKTRTVYSILDQGEALTRDIQVAIQSGDLTTANAKANEYNGLRKDYSQVFQKVGAVMQAAGMFEQVGAWDPMVSMPSGIRGKLSAIDNVPGLGQNETQRMKRAISSAGGIGEQGGIAASLLEMRGQDIVMDQRGQVPDTVRQVMGGKIVMGSRDTFDGFKVHADILDHAGKMGLIDEVITGPMNTVVVAAGRRFGTTDIGTFTSQLKGRDAILTGDNVAILDAAIPMAMRAQDDRKYHELATLKDGDQVVPGIRITEDGEPRPLTITKLDGLMKSTDVSVIEQQAQISAQLNTAISKAPKENRVALTDYYNTRFGLSGIRRLTGRGPDDKTISVTQDIREATRITGWVKNTFGFASDLSQADRDAVAISPYGRVTKVGGRIPGANAMAEAGAWVGGKISNVTGIGESTDKLWTREANYWIDKVKGLQAAALETRDEGERAKAVILRDKWVERAKTALEKSGSAKATEAKKLNYTPGELAGVPVGSSVPTAQSAQMATAPSETGKQVKVKTADGKVQLATPIPGTDTGTLADGTVVRIK